MDFLYRNVHMEQKKWEASTQMTIEEDVNVPEAKGDCLVILLKDTTLHVDETRTGRDQVVIKGSLQYQILYETGDGGRLEQLMGSLPFEEVVHVNGAAPGDMAMTRGVIEDFKVSMINTRKIAIQSVVMLQVCMQQMMEEEWTEDVVNCGNGVEKRFEDKRVMQLCQKKSDVLRIKEEIEIPGGYPPMQNLLWKHVALGDFEARPMDGKVSLKGELNCYFIYVGQGVTQSIKMLSKKVAFHGLMECSGCQSESRINVIPMLSQYTAEIKPDLDGEDRIIFLDAVLDLQLRVYAEEKMTLLQDLYGTTQEITPEEKTVQAPVIHISGEGKCKVKQTHRLKDGTPKAVQILHTCGSVYRDVEVWEDGKLKLMGSTQFQVLYLTGDEEMPYAVTECMVPYSLEMEEIDGLAVDGKQGGRTETEKPAILIEPRIEQAEGSLIDSSEMELKGIVVFSVLVAGSRYYTCVGSAQCKPLDSEKFAALPGMVVCFAEYDTPLWEYGKRYYMSLEELKQLNGRTDDIIKAGESILLVKGAGR